MLLNVSPGQSRNWIIQNISKIRHMKISQYKDLKNKVDNKDNLFLFLDVREEWEYEEG